MILADKQRILSGVVCSAYRFMSPSIPAQHLRIKRAYEPAVQDDGMRVLVERLWPRGIKKEKLVLDAWAKELAPSTELRKWFDHEPSRWDGFRQRYAAELAARPEALQTLSDLRQHARKGALTLVYSARDEIHNGAVTLRDFLLHPELLPAPPPTTGDTP